MESVLESGLFGIDRDRTLVEKALINHAVNQTNRVLLLRILSAVDGSSMIDLLNESFEMDQKNLAVQVDELPKFVM
jgi:hypothetical protein